MLAALGGRGSGRGGAFVVGQKRQVGSGSAERGSASLMTLTAEGTGLKPRHRQFQMLES